MANEEKCIALAVDILLSTYNGENYIAAQLESILSQSYKNWRLLIRDDGSTDTTVDIIRQYVQRYPDSIVYINDLDRQLAHLGVRQSFFQLLHYAEADYIMFCDQDDVWLPHKIQVTLRKMLQAEHKYGETMPLLVFTDLMVVNEQLSLLAVSYYRYRKLNYKIGRSLQRLLTQNIVVGCTVLFNFSLLKRLNVVDDSAIIMHDWWLALAAVVFGKIVFLPETTILYRQHGANVSGTQKWGYKYFWHLLGQLRKLKESYLATQKQAQVFLEQYHDELTPRQMMLVKTYANLKNYNFLKRKYLLLKSGYFKSGLLRNLVLLLLVD